MIYSIQMEKLKFALFSIVTLSLLGIFGYWAVSTIQSGTESVIAQKAKQLQKENANLKVQVSKLANDLDTAQSKIKDLTPVVQKPTSPTVYKYQSLMDEIQKLIDGKVVLKQHSGGSKVGTVQKFLNIYNNTTNKVDNDYGAGTVKAVTAFQKDQKDSGLNANGVADSDTFNAMIEWLKTQ